MAAMVGSVAELVESGEEKFGEKSQGFSQT